MNPLHRQAQPRVVCFSECATFQDKITGNGDDGDFVAQGAQNIGGGEGPALGSGDEVSSALREKVAEFEADGGEDGSGFATAKTVDQDVFLIRFAN